MMEPRKIVRGDIREIQYDRGITSEKLRLQFFARMVVEAGEVLEIEVPRGVWAEAVTLRGKT